MTKESFKKFVKDNKTKIITGTIVFIGTAALAVVGVKSSKELFAKSDSILKDDKIFINLINTIDDASVGCTMCVKLTLPEIAAAINKDGIVKNLAKDPEGNLFEIKSLIAFGNKIEP